MFKIQVATYADVKGIHEIYSHIVSHTHISFEYEVPDLADIQYRMMARLENYPWLVIINEANQHEVVAYGYGARLRQRKAYDWSCELSVYVKPGYKKMGMAGIVYNSLMRILELQRVRNVFGAIALPNQASEYFHQKLGFRKVGEFPQVGFKQNKWNSIAWYYKTLKDSDVPPESFIPFAEISEKQLAGILDEMNLSLGRMKI